MEFDTQIADRLSDSMWAGLYGKYGKKMEIVEVVGTNGEFLIPCVKGEIKVGDWVAVEGGGVYQIGQITGLLYFPTPETGTMVMIDPTSMNVFNVVPEFIEAYFKEVQAKRSEPRDDTPRCPICGREQGYFRGAPACKKCNIFKNIGENGNGLWLRIGTLECVYDESKAADLDDIPF